MQYVLISQMPGQWPGQAQFTAPFDRVAQRNLLFVVKIAIEAADAVQMAVNRFRLQSSVQKIIDVCGQLLIGDRFDGNVQP
jgi:hypothetical protein